MPKIKVICENCGKELYRYPCEIFKHVYCSRECSRGYLSNKMAELNKKLNPTRMTVEVREKLRQSKLGKGNNKSYPKIHGVHAHRVMAEKKLGRKLKPGEIVHHKDGNKQNYNIDNLEILPSQSEHAKLHCNKGRFE